MLNEGAINVSGSENQALMWTIENCLIESIKSKAIQRTGSRTLNLQLSFEHAKASVEKGAFGEPRSNDVYTFLFEKRNSNNQYMIFKDYRLLSSVDNSSCFTEFDSMFCQNQPKGRGQA